MELPTYRCQRCEHIWIPRKPEHPNVCPKCKSPYWDKPRKAQRQEDLADNAEYCAWLEHKNAPRPNEY